MQAFALGEVSESGSWSTHSLTLQTWEWPPFMKEASFCMCLPNEPRFEVLLIQLVLPVVGVWECDGGHISIVRSEGELASRLSHGSATFPVHCTWPRQLLSTP